MRILVFVCLAGGFLPPAVVRPAVAQNAAVHPLQELRPLDSYFPFTPPESLKEWNQRRQQLQRHVQISLGLWPMPQKPPLQPVIHGKLDMGDYTIEKVYFESFPGFLVTGNLYRPANSTGRVPGVLCPHGHFRDGRFRWATDEELASEIESGAEQFETNARSPLQARCANLAMMGCVVFHYDMLGYADSQQITHELAHGFRTQRPHMNAVDGWGFFSPQAELRLQSIMGLQTWNSIRSLDFLCSLNDVDPERIGVTGGSGGGTQTFILCAIDPRPAAAFPAVMVSTAMQGGCTCENCCNLRVAAGNVDFAALFAPKPLGLTAADDWTREMETKGFPELKSLYELYDRDEQLVELTARLEFGHNYNQVSREAMYRFMNRHLSLGREEEELAEKAIAVHQRDVLTVFDDKHPRPEWSERHEQDLLRDWALSGRLAGLNESTLSSANSEKLQESVRLALESLIMHVDSPLAWKRDEDATHDKLAVESGSLLASTAQLESGVALAAVKSEEPLPIDGIVIDLRQGGVNATFRQLEDESSRTAELFLYTGQLATIDLLDPLQDEGQVAGNRLVNNGREASGYTFGYNRTLFSWRVSQVLYLIEFLEERFPDKPVTIHADESMTPVAIVARASAPSDVLVHLEGHLNGFRFAEIDDLRHEHFLPGAIKYGDVDAFLECRPWGRIDLRGAEGDGSR
ncbi:MAG: alpha/beta hydrolase family protein [Pirellulaceae bacterium]